MEVINILIPIAILLALCFVTGFIWMTVKGQYDDLDTPAMRMLIEEKNNKNVSSTIKEKK